MRLRHLLLLLFLSLIFSVLEGVRSRGTQRDFESLLHQCMATRYSTSESTVVIGPQQLQVLLNERSRGTVVLFFDPRCPHYLKYSKAWECSAKAVALLRLNLDLRRVDLTASSAGKTPEALQETGSLMLDLGVKASPTVVYYPSGFQVPNRQHALLRHDGQFYRGNEFLHRKEGKAFFGHNVRWFVAWATALAGKKLQDILEDVPVAGAISALMSTKNGHKKTLLSAAEISVAGGLYAGSYKTWYLILCCFSFHSCNTRRHYY